GKHVTRYENAQDIIKNVRAECEASLKRLNTDYIDLNQLHVWDYPLEPAAALREELEALVREGKIRFYGMEHRLGRGGACLCRRGTLCRHPARFERREGCARNA